MSRGAGKIDRRRRCTVDRASPRRKLPAMTLHLLVVGWLSLLLAPLPSKAKEAQPGPEVYEAQTLQPGYEMPAVTRAPKLNWKPGRYAALALAVPEVVAMEQFDMWNAGPNWPQVEVGVVVVTEHAGDSSRFMAFLVDVRQQRIAAARAGDKAKHLLTIGQMPAAPNGKDPHEALPPGVMTLASSGAVIIVRPPVPPGPAGVPKDLVARMLDAASLVAFADEVVAKGLPI